MYATELVQELNHLIAKHGNLPVEDEVGQKIVSLEYNDDEEEVILIVWDSEPAIPEI